MKKILLCLLALLLIIALTACAPKTPQELEPVTEPPIQEQPDDTEPPEPISEANIVEINIYHLGIRTPLDTNEEQAIAMARQLLSLLANAADTDGMEAPPESTMNPIQIRNGYTALEIVYEKEVALPLLLGDEPLTARQLLFSIPISSSDGGLLYLGHDIYEETPLGRLFDPALQNFIYNNAVDQVERVVFAADGQTVIIAGDEFTYYDEEDSLELSGLLLNRMLYRAIAFYKNAYTGNVNGLQDMSTNTLYNAILLANAGIETTNELGEEVIVNLNSYIMAEYFNQHGIQAPVQQEAGYSVVFLITEGITLRINFAVEEDIPLVSSLNLNISLNPNITE